MFTNFMVFTQEKLKACPWWLTASQKPVSSHVLLLRIYNDTESHIAGIVFYGKCQFKGMRPRFFQSMGSSVDAEKQY